MKPGGHTDRWSARPYAHQRMKLVKISYQINYKKVIHW